MKLIDGVVFLSGRLPALPITSKSAARVRQLFPNADTARYCTAALLLALIVSIVLGAVMLSVPAFALSFAAVFYFLISLPELEIRRGNAEIESALPFFLRELGALLLMGVPFAKALAVAANGKGRLGTEMGNITAEMKSGVSFQKAISGAAIASGSAQFKRAASVLVSSYESGEGSGLAPLSDELLSVQRHALKDASSGVALFGLLFIVFSAVAPTFFLIYFSVGSMAFSVNIPPALFVLGMLLLFPLLSLIILLLAQGFTPRSAMENEAEKFALNPLDFYAAERKKEELEKFLPDALLSIASLPAGASVESAFSAVANGGYGALSVEFGNSLKQFRSKVPLEKVLADLAARNESPALSRAADLLGHVFATNRFRDAARLAEDFLAYGELKRERASLFSVQKYTLFFGSVLIPAILSIATSISSGMGELLGSAPDTGLIFPVIYAYMLIYCGLVSWFVAYSEGRKSLAVAYLPALYALSLITFHALNLVR